MCGIAGSVGGDVQAEARVVESMISAVSHRGPDATGTKAVGACVLGHARLRIIDLSPAGDQPMTNEAATAWVVFNGEIYNHVELRRGLEQRGHVFKSATDTEVIVHLYEEHGSGLVHQLRGMFAFAIWDSTRQLLLLARDRLGIKPLYYRQSGKSLRFASESQALTSPSSQLNSESVRAYLQLGWVPGPATIWEDIGELAPGHLLTWHKGTLDIRRYWSVPMSPRSTSQDQLTDALEDSLRRHLVADVPVGLFLSSGVDSSVLACLLTRVGGSAKAFTVAFEGRNGEEADAARLASALGIDHTIARTDGSEILGSIRAIVGSLDQPSVDGVNAWVVSEAVRREGIVVALSGLGGDELFRGYSTFRHVPRLAGWARNMHAVPSGAWCVGSALVHHTPRWAHSRSARALDALSTGSWAAAYSAVRGLLPQADVVALLGPGTRPGTAIIGPGPGSADDKVRQLELANYLPFQLLRDTDAMSMAHALEVRVPLLDDSVVAAAGQFDKAGFAAAVHPGLLPRARGKKKTFTLPFNAWLRGPLRAQAGDAVISLEGLGMDGTHLRELWAAFGRNELDWRPIWALAVLGIWADGHSRTREMSHERASTTPPGPVLILGNKWPSREAGGLNRYVSSLGAALRRQGIDAQATVLGPADGAPVWVNSKTNDRRSLPVRVMGMTSEAARVGKEAAVVDVHFALYGLLPVLATRLRRRHLVVHFHGPWALESQVAGHRSRTTLILQRRIEQALQRRAGRIVTESAAFKQVLVERYGASPWTIDVVSPGVDLETFSPGHEDARATIGLAAQTQVVLVVRRLEARMGLGLLLEAWTQIAPSNPNAVLVIGGTGSLAEELRSQAERLNIAGAVRFLGAVSEEALVSWYRTADFTVVPSLALEGYGLIVLESLACGTPTLVSDIGGLPEAVAGLDRSLVVRAGDSRAWAARMTSALADRGSMPSADACRRYAERFTWDTVATRHRNVYRAAGRTTPTRLRVAYIDHCAELSGGELSLVELLDSMRTVDTHVVLACDGPLAGRLRIKGLSVEVLELAGGARDVTRGEVGLRLPWRAIRRTAAYVIRLTWRLRQLRPDVVHTNSLKAAMYGGLAGRLAGIPVVWHIRDQLVAEEYPPLARLLVRTSARMIPSAIITNSASTLRQLGGGLPATAVVPSIIVPPGERTVRKQRAAGTPLRLGMVGRLAPWKGQHVFLAAFARAFPEGDEEAVLIGQALFHDSGYESQLQLLVDRLGLKGRVEFRGHRDDVPGELERLDIFVHASVTPEPFGRVIVEAMAAELPVIASRAGGPMELLDHERTGLLVTPNDVAALATAMQRLAASRELRRQLAGAARQVASQFSAERVVEGVMGIYGRALAPQYRRSPR